MSEGEPEKWVKAQMNRAKSLWLVSIVMMSFTFLSALYAQFEFLHFWSKALLYVVEQWREVLHTFWEFIINIVMRILQLPFIRIETPYPELLTIASLFALSIRKNNEIEAARKIIKTNTDDRTNIILGVLCGLSLVAITTSLLSTSQNASLIFHLILLSIIIITFTLLIFKIDIFQYIFSMCVLSFACVTLSFSIIIFASILEVSIFYASNLIDNIELHHRSGG